MATQHSRKSPRSAKRAPAKPAARKTAARKIVARAVPKARPPGVGTKKAPARAKWVYAFGGGKAQGRGEMRNLLGGKGAGLAEMAQLGLPVPPGFTITTEVCTYFYAHGKKYPQD